MSEPDMKTIETRLESLGASPLFRLSLASNELFHSNFLHWLLQLPAGQAAAKAQELFCEMIDVPERRIVEPQREKDHYDLVMTLVDGTGGKTRKVIVENKVKSWRDLDQLGEYSKKAREKEKLPLLFVLLSMTVPPGAEDGLPFRDKQGGSWMFCSYERLNERFIKPLMDFTTGKDDAYLAALLADYSTMIANMAELLELDLFPNGKEEGALGRLTPARIRELSDKLKEGCKLNAIFEKALFERYEAMAAGILARQPAAGRYQCTRGLEDRNIANGGINISSGYSSSGQKGYLNLAYRCEKGLVIGVQIEGNQYRHFISHAVKGQAVDDYVDSYFDPGHVGARAVPGPWIASSGRELDPPAGNSRYVEYCAFDDTHFLYLHTSIEDRPMAEILEVAAQDILLQASKASSLERREPRLTARKEAP